MLWKNKNALTDVPLATLKWFLLEDDASSGESQLRGSKQCVAPVSRIGGGTPDSSVTDVEWKEGRKVGVECESSMNGLVESAISKMHGNFFHRH